MTRLVIAAALTLTLCVVAPAIGQDAGLRKRVLDARIDNLEQKIERARDREGVLSSQIEVVTQKIAALEGEVGSAQARLDRLESELVLQQRRLDRLNELFHLQTSRLEFLQAQHAAATVRLNRRLVEIYTSDPTEPLSVVLEAASFGDMLDQLEFLSDIGRQDEKIVTEVRRAKLHMHRLRENTKETREAQVETTRAVEARTAEQRAARDRLAWSQRELATARQAKQSTLNGVRADRNDAQAHMDELEAESAALAARIQAAQAARAAQAAQAAQTERSAHADRATSQAMPSPASSEPASPEPVSSGSGFIWPVHGVVTSVFGWRWGRMHEGIDIAVASGTPVVSAAAGTVIIAGWSGGYGNLVVVDHGNGIATAYGHNTNVTVFVGQSVSQGQLIAYSGSTGHSTGPHVHFEVRVNGAATDPFGYL